MSSRLETPNKQISWIGLVVVVVTLVATSWLMGWEKTGIGLAAVLIALWEARE